MKTRFFSAFVFILFSCLFLNLIYGQNPGIELIPPGTIQLENKVYIDKTPVTNLMFLEYLTFKALAEDLGYNTFKEYLNLSKDARFPLKPIITYPNAIGEKSSKDVFLKRRGYFREREYAYSAVLEVSIEDATDFCSWRTAMVKHFYQNQNIEFSKLQYRLATLEELNYAKRKYQSILKTKPSRKKLSNYNLPRNPDFYMILPIYEFTSTVSNFQSHLETAYTGFRCICDFETK